MTEYEFYGLVKKMRDAQTDYFHNRTPNELRKARGYEQKVDNAIKQFFAPPETQIKMFQ
jgi:hypothetical protein